MGEEKSGRSHLLPLLAIGAIAIGRRHRPRPADQLVPAGGLGGGRGRSTRCGTSSLIVSVPIFVLVQTIVLYSVWRFRMRPGEELKDGPPIHGNTRLEVIWTAIPAIILVALCSYAYVVLHDIEKAEASEMKVRVVGEQFTWTFFYPGGSGGKEIASNQLYLPKGKQVRFDVQSKDVLHDFWVPAFRQKIDAVPGITTHIRVKPIKTGTFPVVCAELCGLGHSVMRQSAHVVSPGAFDKWLADKKAQGGRRRRAGGEEARGGGGGAAARRQGALRERRLARLRLLPHARRRGRRPARSARTSTRCSRARTRPSSSSRSRTRSAEVAKGFQDGIMPTNYRRHPPAGGDQGADRLPCGGRDQVMEEEGDGGEDASSRAGPRRGCSRARRAVRGRAGHARARRLRLLEPVRRRRRLGREVPGRRAHRRADRRRRCSSSSASAPSTTGSTGRRASRPAPRTTPRTARRPGRTTSASTPITR